MKKIFLSFLLLLSIITAKSQKVNIGTNFGYYGGQFSANNLTDLAYSMGIRSARIGYKLQQYLQWGASTFTSQIQYTYNKGMQPQVFTFDAPPSAGTYNGQSDTVLSNGQQSMVPQTLWLPTFNSDGTVNTNNLWAKYVYDVVNTVGAYITYYEMWNEPDYSSNSSSWGTTEPQATDLPNINSSLEDYIQVCKVTYQVVKKYYPNALITTGGFGNPNFYNWFLQKGGGQWIDVLSLHQYPVFASCNGSTCNRNSDALVSVITNDIQNYRNVENSLGKPNLPVIYTECNIPRWDYGTLNTYWGESTAQRNWVIKIGLKSKLIGVNYLYLFQLGETADSGTLSVNYYPPFPAMGLYKNMNTATLSTITPTTEGYAIQTLQKLSQNYNLDASQPTFPSGIDGVRLDSSGNKIIAIWAKTTSDISEVASANYTLPTGISYKKISWNGTLVGTVSGTIPLTGEPIYLMQTSGNIIPPINDTTVATLAATNDSTGRIKFTWSASREGNDSLWVIDSSLNNSTWSRFITTSSKATNGTSYTSISYGPSYYYFTPKTALVTIAGFGLLFFGFSFKKNRKLFLLLPVLLIFYTLSCRKETITDKTNPQDSTTLDSIKSRTTAHYHYFRLSVIHKDKTITTFNTVKVTLTY